MINVELKDTVDMMNSADYEERFKAEYWQLAIRLKKLADMLYKYKKGELNFTPKCSYELLKEQLTYMRLYIKMLENRAEIEDIELDSE